ERLMDHWKATLDLPILTVQYEELVADQERITRRIIDFLGLPWDDRCLRYWEADRTVMTLSYDQVNKPIYDSSIGRWRKYEMHLGPLKKALGLAEEA
ncbi:MAG TPA: sulfotransferase, partial [Phycisphaerales bacterium]|nr:sulfotransferase [Phycisphaerales bacterium]